MELYFPPSPPPSPPSPPSPPPPDREGDDVWETVEALDMARLGLLALAEGRWDGRVVLDDPVYREAMLSPGSDANPAWCYLWWRNDQRHFMVPFRDEPNAGRSA